MVQQSNSQKETVKRVMHEYKHGELKSRGNGPKVKNPKQAIAIARFCRKFLIGRI
jgi:hypothetical protein